MASIILCEGHNEKILMKSLNAIGRTEIFNIWEKDISKIIKKFSKQDEIFIIYDTDVIDQAKIDLFKKNIKILKQNKIKIKLLQQNKNLEDALCRACGNVSFSKIALAFNCKSTSKKEFKSCFNKTTNITSILNQLNFNKDILFSKDAHESLKEFNNLIGVPKYL